jgi:hypothetical protein
MPYHVYKLSLDLLIQEDQALLDLYSTVYGPQWVPISRKIGTKSAHQCADR